MSATRYPAPDAATRSALAREARAAYDAEAHDEWLIAAADYLDGKDPRQGWYADPQAPHYAFTPGESVRARLLESAMSTIDCDRRQYVVEIARRVRDAIAYDILSSVSSYFPEPDDGQVDPEQYHARQEWLRDLQEGL